MNTRRLAMMVLPVLLYGMGCGSSEATDSPSSGKDAGTDAHAGGSGGSGGGGAGGTGGGSAGEAGTGAVGGSGGLGGSAGEAGSGGSGGSGGGATGGSAGEAGSGGTGGGTGGTGGTGGGSSTCAPLDECSGVCVDFATDPDYCGNCSTSCKPHEACLAGHCQMGVGSLVLSEVRAQAPSFFEIYNGGATSLNLGGYQVQWSTDGFGTGSFELPSYDLGPGEFVTLVEGTGASEPGQLRLGTSVAWISHLAVRLTNAGGYGLDFVRTGSSSVTPPTGTTWSGSNAPNPSAWTNQSLVRNITKSDTNSAEDWSLVSESSPGSFCPRASQCGGECLDVTNAQHSCGACGFTCSSSQVCLDGSCSQGYTGLWISEYRRSQRAGVEIHNPTPETITLTGYRLDVLGPTTLSYVFPTMTIEPGAFLFLYLGTGVEDNNSLFVGPSAAFGADVAVALYDDAAIPLDFVRFGNSTAAPPSGASWFGANVPTPDNGFNQSAKRKLDKFDTDGASDWVVNSPATPGYGCVDGLTSCSGSCVDISQNPAHCGGCGNGCGPHETCRGGVCRTVGAVVISELRNASYEYFELFNGTASTVDLSAWEVHWNADGGNGAFVVPSGIKLDPGKFLRLHESSGTSTSEQLMMGTAINWTDWIAVRVLKGTSEIDLVRTGSSPVYGQHWNGVPVDNPPEGQSIVRNIYAADTDSAADWTVQASDSPSRYCKTANESVCAGQCDDLSKSATNCGACGNACPFGNICNNGVCVEQGAIRMNKYGSFNGTSSGRPEMFFNGRWHVSYNSITTPVATVICRQLGFPNALSGSSSAGSCGSSSTCGYLLSITCSGNEALLEDCSFSNYTGDYTGYSVRCEVP